MGERHWLLDEYFTAAELAREIEVCVKTLERWRGDNKGPPITKIGRRILYRKASVVRWLVARELAPAVR